MKLKDKPAYARPWSREDAPEGGAYYYHEALSGMTLREYAAIKLGVPDSGDEELDAMIRKSRRERLAGLATQGLVKRMLRLGGSPKDSAGWALDYADALIAQLEEEESKGATDGPSEL